MTQPDRYSRNPVDLSTWMRGVVGDAPPTPPAVVTIMDVLRLGLRYAELHAARVEAIRAHDAHFDPFVGEFEDEAFKAWVARKVELEDAVFKADEAAAVAYFDLRTEMRKHAAGDVHTVSGRIEGRTIKVRFEPVRDAVTVDVTGADGSEVIDGR